MSKYRADIDGLRGIAILAVLFHHADAVAFPGGFVGVDIFFVISGFVITTTIQRSIAVADFSFLHFYARRVKRLLPAAMLMMATVLCAAWLLFLPLDYRELGATVAASCVMLANVQFWRMNDYFAGQERLWPLLHMWSLSVEEQFYLLYPAIAVALFRLASRIRIAVIAALLIFSFAVSVWQVNAAPRAAYYMLPSRAWEMLAGALVAVVPASPSGRAASSVIAVAAATAIMAPVWLYSHSSRFPGILALAPVVGTMAMIWVTSQQQHPLRRLLAWKPLVGIGLVSYSLYLWHWPLMIFGRYLWSGMPEAYPRYMPYVAMAISGVVASLSYCFVESPCRRLCWTNQRVIAIGGIASLMVGGAGLAINFLNGVPQRLAPTVLKLANAARDINPRRQETMRLPVERIRAGGAAYVGASQGGSRPCFALWGDSHGDVLVPLFEKIAQERNLTGVCFCRGGTLPVGTIHHEHPAG